MCANPSELCPVCGSYDTELLDMEQYDDRRDALTVYVQCNACGARYDQIFTYSHAVIYHYGTVGPEE